MGDMLSQAEIDALLGGGAPEETEETEELGANEAEAETPPGETALITDEQKDILGEIGNISMGTSATTLFALLGQKVTITTPRVYIISWKSLAGSYEKPCVGIRVDYKEGIKGSNILILKDRDVKIITSLMMGGDGKSDIDGELNEIDLSAISEVMNQMVGSSSTSLSSLVKLKIDIDTPRAFMMDLRSEPSDILKDTVFDEDKIVCIKFKMQIEGFMDSEIMQALPLNFALDMVAIMEDELKLMGKVEPRKDHVPPSAQDMLKEANKPEQQAEPVPRQHEPAAQPPPPQVPPSIPPNYQNQMPYVQQPMPHMQNVNVQPIQFQSFDLQAIMQQKENIAIIMDVPIEVTVELGRASKKIKEILEFAPGAIVELDKLAGEPIDVLVNGKPVAKGEVVVVDENFSVRITDIVSVENRI